jgi:hypothetical protein
MVRKSIIFHRNLLSLTPGRDVVFAGMGLPIAPNTSYWTPKVEAESEVEWQTALGQALDLTYLVQAGSYYQPPSYGWSAQSFFASANARALEYIRVFSHHNYPQTTFAGHGDPPNLETLMSHSNITANVAPYADDAKVAHMNGLQYVFGETNAGELFRMIEYPAVGQSRLLMI